MSHNGKNLSMPRGKWPQWWAALALGWAGLALAQAQPASVPSRPEQVAVSSASEISAPELAAFRRDTLRRLYIDEQIRRGLTTMRRSPHAEALTDPEFEDLVRAFKVVEDPWVSGKERVRELRRLADGRGAERWVHRELLLLWASEALYQSMGDDVALETQRWRAVAQQDPRARGLAVTADLVDAHLAWRSQDPMRMSMFLDRALQNAREPELSLHRWRMLMLQAGRAELQGHSEALFKHRWAMMHLSEAWCLPRYRHQALVQMASLMYDHHDSEQGKELMRSAQRVADATMNPLLWGITLSYQGGFEPSGSELTAQHLQRAVALLRLVDARSELSDTLASLADVYLRAKDWRMVLKLTTEAERVARETGNVDAMTLAQFNMSMALIATRQVEKGRLVAEGALERYARDGALQMQADGWLELAQALEAAGDAHQAVRAYLAHFDTLAKATTQRKARSLTELQLAFQQELQAKQLHSLKQANVLADRQLERGKLLQRSYWGIAVASVAFIVMVALGLQRMRRLRDLLEQTNVQLRQLGERDPLTGLHNRRAFYEALAGLGMEEAMRGTVMLMDVDGFKQINDQHGHGAGDLVLKAVSDRLRKALRDDDLVVRWGGEEFLVWTPQLRHLSVQELGRRIIEAVIAEPVLVPGKRLPISVSMGAAQFPLPPTSLQLGVDQTLRVVDAALYQAKKRGRSRLCEITRVEAESDQALMADVADLAQALAAHRVQCEEWVHPDPSALVPEAGAMAGGAT